MALRTVPAPFLTKTFQLVDDRSSDDVISWNEAGTAFVVWKMADFAKDLLPSYFKHNNFSSFVRQLNTYGFRKIVPDKWEFANDNFKRGQKELLTKIRRRKTVSSTAAAKKLAAGCDGPSSPSNSGEDQGSASLSSPDSKNAGSVDAPNPEPVADLSDENEKLKRENDLLNSELAQSKKQCDELVAFLTEHVKIGSDQINQIMRQGTCGSTSVGEIDGCDEDDTDDGDENEEAEEESNDRTEEEEEEEKEGFRLFGVWVKGDGKKRGRDENTETGGTRNCKGLRTAEFDAPWMKISPSPGVTGKVCE